ncbi:c-type cytochrome [Sulfurimonas sp. C5]|uniref:c-type cytochrome n=1 Tax=Sulfurimonas sp. C5 TaxID=3036947 RepID=UPI002456E0BE|nr:c-type cytochrome [Sulfurimonas sp. C5]MDH4944242.1 hypothetical protein [Sulfurimonas sp. C5]
MKIVLSAVLAMFLVACGNNTEEKKAVENVESETVKVEETKAPETVEKVEVEETKIVETPVVEEKAAVEEVKKVVEEVKTVTVEKPAPVKAPEPVKVVEKTIDGGALFVKCVACHGQNAEKSALGKSQIIKGWSVDKVLTALHGYKDGTYGGAMKGIMKSQVSAYSEDELKALAQHISKL